MQLPRYLYVGLMKKEVSLIRRRKRYRKIQDWGKLR